jgi:hypothetical protein
MSDKLEEELTTAFVHFGRMFAKGSVIVEGFVTDVDGVNYTCSVNVPRNSNGSSIDNIYYNVPLKILRGSQASFIEIPHITSHCLLTFKDNNTQRPTLYSVDQCDKILVRVGTVTLEINTGKDSENNDIASFVFNGGSQGNMVLIQKAVDKLNIIEQDINKLKTSFSTWVVVPSDGGAALKAAAASWSGSKLTETKKEDLENKNILQ